MPLDTSQAGQALERAGCLPVQRQGAQRQVLGEHDGRCVCGFFKLDQAASRQAADSDFGQCLHPQSQEHCAIDKVARQARRYPVFSARLQPRTQPHRAAMAQDQIHVDGSQVQNGQRVGG